MASKVAPLRTPAQSHPITTVSRTSLTFPSRQLAIVSVGNSIQAYSTLANTREVYAGSSPNPTTSSPGKANTSLPDGVPARTIPSEHASPVTPLSARTFGTWTLLASLVRLYGAYHIHEPAVYELCIWTYVIAWGHFMSEWWVFGSARWTRGLAGPVVIANVSLVWMLMQWGWYVKG